MREIRGVYAKVDVKMSNSLKENPLSLIINSELTEVDYVLDYLQLKFNNYNLVILIKTKIIVNNKIHKFNSMLFRHYLDGCINHLVKDIILVDDDSIRLFFSNELILEISLKPDDYLCPEAINFFNDSQKLWFVM